MCFWNKTYQYKGERMGEQKRLASGEAPASAQARVPAAPCKECPGALLSKRQLILRHLFRAAESASLRPLAWWKMSEISRGPSVSKLHTSKFTDCCGFQRYQTCLVESRSLKGQHFYVNSLLFIPLYALLLWPPASNTPVFMLLFIMCTMAASLSPLLIPSSPLLSCTYFPLLSFFPFASTLPYFASSQQDNYWQIEWGRINRCSVSAFFFSFLQTNTFALGRK